MVPPEAPKGPIRPVWRSHVARPSGPASGPGAVRAARSCALRSACGRRAARSKG